MTNKDIFGYYKKMQKKNVVLFLNGFIDQNLLVNCLELFKGRLAKNFIYIEAIKKIFFIIIEFSQNIMRYSAERIYDKNESVKIGKGILMICENKNNFVLTAGNLIKNVKIILLKELCDKINQLDKKALKQFYKKNLKNRYFKESYGANIGLIDIVRKTGHALNYDIKRINDKDSFFVVSVTVDKGTEGNYFIY